MPIISGEDNKMASSSLVGVLKQGENHHYFLGIITCQTLCNPLQSAEHDRNFHLGSSLKERLSGVSTNRNLTLASGFYVLESPRALCTTQFLPVHNVSSTTPAPAPRTTVEASFQGQGGAHLHQGLEKSLPLPQHPPRDHPDLRSWKH